MRHLAPFLALLLTLGTINPAFAAAVRFGQEAPLSATRYGEPPSRIEPSGLATSGDGFLAAWVDTRGGVFVARLAADGTVLDPSGIFLDTWPDGSPAVAWTGRSYVVVWQRDAYVYASTVTSDGVVSQPRLVALDPGEVRVASTGSTILITVRTPAATTAYLLDLDLNRIADRRLVPHRSSLRIYELELAVLRDGYLLAALLEGFSVTTFALDGNGVLSNPLPIADSQGASHVSVAASGNDFLVVWDMAATLLRGRVITPANQPAGALKLLDQVLGSADARRRIEEPQLVWRDGEYLLAYRDGNYDVRLLRISAAGERLGESTESVARLGIYRTRVLLTTKSDGSGAVFYVESSDFDGPTRPLVRLFSTAAEPALGAPLPLLRTAQEQVRPAAAQVGATSVVTWLEQSFGSNEIRVSLGGRELVVAHPLATPLWLDVVDDGGTLWVLWVTGDSKKLHLRRFTRTLEPLDETLRQLSLPNDFLSVEAAEGGGGAVAIVSATDDGRDLVATVIRAGALDVEVLDHVGLTLQPHQDYGARVAFDGTNFVVVWQHALESAPWLPEEHDLQLARITPQAELLDFSPWLLSSVRGDYRGFGPLQVVNANGRIVVAWQRTTGTYAAFLTGTLLGEPRQVHSLNVDQSRLGQIVALPDGSIDFYYWDPETWDVQVVQHRHDRVPSALTTDTEPRVIVELPGGALNPSGFAATANGSVARFIYLRRAMEPEYGAVVRLFERTGGFTGPSRRRSVR